jgi:excinuclease ABC subunit A
MNVEKEATQADSRERPIISIQGARANNLKNIDVKIPKNALVVVSGVSGSGKSSLAIDTLYAEGQRRYVESLSSYARQFMSRMKKPEVDTIKGICPAIAVDQRSGSGNTRSTVGSMTEINEFLRLLFARVGRTYSPVSGQEVRRHQVSDVIDFIRGMPEGTRCHLVAPFSQKHEKRRFGDELTLWTQKGFSRIWADGETRYIDDLLNESNPDLQKTLTELAGDNMGLLVDRFVRQAEDDETMFQRLADSVKTCFDESGGYCVLWAGDTSHRFNQFFEADGMRFMDPEPNLFNPNNSFGACPVCEGYGQVIGISEDKVVPDKTLSVYEGAVAAWKGESGQWWRDQFVKYAVQIDFPIHRSYEHLTDGERDLLWNGNAQVEGIHAYFRSLEEKTYKIQNRVLLARYRGKTTCPTCRGSKLRAEANYVKIDGKGISDYYRMPVTDMRLLMLQLPLTETEKAIADRLLMELKLRLDIMDRIGLGYLTMERAANTLSGGEVQRINLTRTLSSNLTASLYILDEPSIGLHPRDTDKLISVLFQLRDLGNSVVLVEHDEDIIRQADYLIDIGPGAGVHGGRVVFEGNFRTANPGIHGQSLTVQYLHRKEQIPTKKIHRTSSNWIRITGARANNLKNFDVQIPLQALTVVSGVSGSGKSSLVRQVLIEGLQQILGGSAAAHGAGYRELSGDTKQIQHLEFISQNPMGRSSRSNPVTYVKAFDHIRDLYTRQPLAKMRGYKPKHFSFNVEGGRCETCKGEGEIIVEMQFLADVALPCEDCQSRRFKKEILEVEFQGKNIFEVLDMPIEEAIPFFQRHSDIVEKIKPLEEVGLGYLKLGQSSSTLSGGEAQRVKLASYLGKSQSDKIFFIFDEPTTGLHLHDIRRLLHAFEALVERGHTVLVVEHHLDVIKNADYIIDLGPEAGENGGHLLYQGPVNDFLKVENSYTSRYLIQKMAQDAVPGPA